MQQLFGVTVFIERLRSEELTELKTNCDLSCDVSHESAASTFKLKTHTFYFYSDTDFL
jgi:hypothetical protein